MAGLILETKLRRPQLRSSTIARTRLIERLTRGAELPLTLVSAPAGFGKTTLLTEWLAAGDLSGRTTGWLSLDARDNDSTTFWRYLASALATAAPGVGEVALSLLEAGAAAVESVVGSLINDLDALPHDVVVVLDDYHLIESVEIHDSMEYLLTHMPANAHVVLATRSDPGLPLAQFRARGQLTEVRATDLRFSAAEAAAYLNGAMGLNLTAADVDTLDSRTEGWIAALQLAALSIQGRHDASAFIAGFAGDDRYIVDYLAEEVLQRQPDAVRQFLLRTSILESMTGSLCDALTGHLDGKAILVSLDRGNLFLVPLDDRRQWYRYHHLFADVLRAHLLDEAPDLVAGLHSAASQWYDGAGEPADAIRHALAAGDFAQAADLVERASPAMQQNRQEVALRDWISSLPGDVVRVRPVLSNTLAGALLSTGQFDGVESLLADAERFIDATSGSVATSSDHPEMVVVDDFQFQRLPAYVAVHRAGYSLVTGDIDGAVAHARRALDLATAQDHIVRAAATALIGLASWSTGDLVVAERAYDDCLVDMTKALHFADALGCSIALADIRLVLGHLGRAERTYRDALELAAAQSGPPLRGSADMLVGLSEVQAEHGDVDAARNYLTQALQMGDVVGLPQYPYRRRLALARIREAEGDLDEALDLLQQAVVVFTSDLSPNVRPIPAMIARLKLKMGHTDGAVAWADDRALSADDELDYLHEFEHITLARVLLTQHATERDEDFLRDAIGLLDRLLQAADDGERTASVIEIQVLRSLAFHAAGSISDAHTAMRRAVERAEPQGQVRVFANEGAPVRALLKGLGRRERESAFVRRLMSASLAPSAPRQSTDGLVDPLSERELDVLRLLATDLDGPAIARHLFVSLNTMRTHTRSIYTKLAVTNRRTAVRKARELNLLS